MTSPIESHAPSYGIAASPRKRTISPLLSYLILGLIAAEVFFLTGCASPPPRKRATTIKPDWVDRGSGLFGDQFQGVAVVEVGPIHKKAKAKKAWSAGVSPTPSAVDVSASDELLKTVTAATGGDSACLSRVLGSQTRVVAHWRGSYQYFALATVTKSEVQSCVKPAKISVAEPDQAVQLEKDAQTAEESGKFDEAYTKLGEAIAACGPNVTDDVYQRTRAEMLKVVGKLAAKPDIPEEARRHMARGRAFVESARDQKGFTQAISEMEQGLILAPWWATGYFNLGLTQESAKDYDGAIRSFKLYLIAAPESPDARSVKDKIYKLEADKEIEASR